MLLDAFNDSYKVIPLGIPDLCIPSGICTNLQELHSSWPKISSGSTQATLFSFLMPPLGGSHFRISYHHAQPSCWCPKLLVYFWEVLFCLTFTSNNVSKQVSLWPDWSTMFLYASYCSWHAYCQICNIKCEVLFVKYILAGIIEKHGEMLYHRYLGSSTLSNLHICSCFMARYHTFAHIALT